jgi:uncharacterized protein
MRRKDREITDIDEILKIIDQCQVCRVAMIDNGKPYIVPLNFGYYCKDGALELYFHSALQGRKIEVLRSSPRVCFEMDCSHHLVVAEAACSYSFRYESVIGEGTVALIEDAAEKAAALTCIMRHMAKREFEFSEKETRTVAILKLSVDSVSAKALRS